MEDQKHTTSLTFEIDNFSEKESVISSPNFLSGGCEWYVDVFPKGVCINDQSMYLYLCVGNPESYLRLGWKIRASFSFVVLNQSLKELYRLDEPCRLFCAQLLAWGRYVPLEKLKEKGFLEKNKLILKVQVKVVEVVDEGGDKILDVNGRILVPGSMLSSVISLFMKYEDISRNFRPKNQLVKTAYMNDVLGFIEILNKPPYSLSETELSNTLRDLIEITEAGFELEWLLEKHEYEVVSVIKTVIDGLNQETKAMTCEVRDWLEGVVHSWKVRVGFADVGKAKID